MRSIGLLFEERCRSEALCSMRLLPKPAPRCKQLNKVAEIISEEIAQRGSITFARFMELALYCPVYGFYELEQDTIGRRGDFYTSVSVGSLFGELLAWQFADWLEESTVQAGSQRRGVQGSATFESAGAALNGL